jgi:hypothetical protein
MNQKGSLRLINETNGSGAKPGPLTHSFAVFIAASTSALELYWRIIF